MLFINIMTLKQICYKLERKRRAIINEEKALKISNESAEKSGFPNPLADTYLEVITKMKKGLPTWNLIDDFILVEYK